MDCGQRVERMWSPSGEGTRMDDFRARVNMELQLTLSEWKGLKIRRLVVKLMVFIVPAVWF